MNINNKNSDEFEILRKINNLEKPNQRDLAYELGFSLGKLNYCIKALRKKGISYKSKMAYFFMKQKIAEYENLKKEFKNNPNK